jgi:hypothetical protein
MSGTASMQQAQEPEASAWSGKNCSCTSSVQYFFWHFCVTSVPISFQQLVSGYRGLLQPGDATLSRAARLVLQWSCSGWSVKGLASTYSA